MSYLDHFEDEEPDYADVFEEFLDDDEDWSLDDEEVEAILRVEEEDRAEREKPRYFNLSEEDRIEFISLLLSNDNGAMAVAAEYLNSRRTVVTEALHTLWSGQETTDGFYVYHINHNLGTEQVLVSLDSTEMWTYAVKDHNTIVVVCPEKLWGVDVTVEIREAA